MAATIRFQVTANDDASGTFAAVAAAATALDRALAKLDRKVSAKVDVQVPASALAKISAVDAALDRIDGRVATARVRVASSSADLRNVDAVAAALRAFNGRSADAAVRVEIDESLLQRISRAATYMQQMGAAARFAASGVSRLRTFASYIVDPESIPLVQRLSDAIATRFRAAVETGTTAISKLRVALLALNIGVAALGSIGNVAPIIGGLSSAIGQMAGVAVAAPAAVLSLGAAFVTARIALSGFWDAVKAEDPKAFAEAVKGWAPAARDAAQAFRGMQGEAEKLRQSVQAQFFRRMGDEIRQLGSTYLPVLKTGLSGIATEMGNTGRATLQMVRETQQVRNVEAIFKGTQGALAQVRTAAGNVVAGFLQLGAAGAQFGPRVGAAIDDVARRFRIWATQITTDGTFERWVRQGVVAFQQLGSILGNIGSTVRQVFSALNSDGRSFLGTLEGLTSELKTFVHSTEAVNALRGMGEVFRAAGQAIRGIFLESLRAISPIISTLAPLFARFAIDLQQRLVGAIQTVAPLMQRLADAMAAHPDLMLSLARAAAILAVAFGPAAAAVGMLASVLKGLILARAVGAALTAMGIGAGALRVALIALVSPISALRMALPMLATGAGRLAASLMLAMGPIGWLIAGFTALYAASDQFRTAVNTVAATVGQILVQMGRDMLAVFAATVGLVVDFAAAIASAFDAIGKAGSAALSGLGPAGQFVADVMRTIADAVGPLPGMLSAVFVAFLVFSKVAPIFNLAAAAATGFAARMSAVQASSALGAAALTGLSAAATRAATALSTIAARLPAIGTALVALGALAMATSVDFDDAIQKMANGTMSFGAAVKQVYEESTTGLLGFINWLEGDSITHNDIVREMTKRWEEYRNSLSPMEQLKVDVARAQAELNDAIVEFGKDSSAAKVAAEELRAAEDRLAAAERDAAEAAKTQAQRERELGDTIRSQIGAMLDYEDAVRRTAEAHREATEVLKKNGQSSEEYKAAVNDVVRAIDHQAEAAKRQAEAWGGAEAGLKIYSLELMRAADLSTQAGRDAFIKLASVMDKTGLDAISAAARMSGLRTEIIKLPGNREVRVVVEADQGKLPTVQEMLQQIEARPYIGKVKVLATTEDAKGSITQIVEFANGQQGTIRMHADGRPATLEVNGIKYMIDQTTGTLKVMGDVSPGEANLNGFKLKVDSTTGQITIDGNAAPAEGAILSAVQFADGSTGVIQIDGNPSQFEGKTQYAITLADGSKGTITIDGNPDPATGQVQATIRYANGQTGTVTINARDLASPVINSIPRNVTTTVTIRTIYSGTSPAQVRMAGAGGGVVGFSRGGVVGMARGGVIRGYQPGVDTVPALLSRGEAVLVPELVRELGARRILEANREASGRRRGLRVGSLAGMMDGLIGRTQTIRKVATIRPKVQLPAVAVHRGVAGSDSAAIVAGLVKLGNTLRDELRDASDIAHGDALLNARSVRAIADAVVAAMRADSGEVASSARRTARLGLHA